MPLPSAESRPYPRFVSDQAFRRALEAVLTSGVPSDGDNLLGMEMDFVVRLSGLDELDAESVTVRRTERAEALIVATCRTAEGVPLAVAAAAVRDIWLDDLRYAESEAHSLSVSEDAAELRFMTQMRPGGLFVTGVVELGGN